MLGSAYTGAAKVGCGSVLITCELCSDTWNEREREEVSDVEKHEETQMHKNNYKSNNDSLCLVALQYPSLRIDKQVSHLVGFCCHAVHIDCYRSVNSIAHLFDYS